MPAKNVKKTALKNKNSTSPSASSFGDRVDTVAQNLNRWFAKHARDLPWRDRPEPYFVWLSEVMLQQTQVVTVLPYFDRFIQKFPTIGDLANAHLDEIYSLWAGLGYYSRARNLHKGAQAIQAKIEKGEGFPKNREEWLAIPGVGEYTAGAVCSIALNQREAIVDGNVIRVLSRVFAVGKIDSAKSEIWELAREMVAVKKVQPRAINQSLMELGALICKPKNPQCEQCPLLKECKGKTRLHLYPPPKPKKEWKQVKEEKWVLLHQGKVFLIQGEGKWRAGLWDFPSAQDAALRGITKAKLIGEETTRYVVTQHKVQRKHFIYELKTELNAGTKAMKTLPQGQWFDVKDLPGVPAPVKKFLSRGNF